MYIVIPRESGLNIQRLNWKATEEYWILNTEYTNIQWTPKKAGKKVQKNKNWRANRKQLTYRPKSNISILTLNANRLNVPMKR